MSEVIKHCAECGIQIPRTAKSIFCDFHRRHFRLLHIVKFAAGFILGLLTVLLWVLL
jgi:hypothetical protein